MFPAHSSDIMRAYARFATNGRDLDRNAEHLRAVRETPQVMTERIARAPQRPSVLRRLLALHAAFRALRP